MRNGLKKWIEFSHWLDRTETPPLAEDEQVVLDSPAFVMDWLPLAAEGRLVLTTQRLFYLPVRPRDSPFQFRVFRYLPGLYIPATRVELQLDDIQALGRRSRLRGLYGGFPGLSIFTITLCDGEHYAFQTPLRGSFGREIVGLQPEIEAT